MKNSLFTVGDVVGFEVSNCPFDSSFLGGYMMLETHCCLCFPYKLALRNGMLRAECMEITDVPVTMMVGWVVCPKNRFVCTFFFVLRKPSSAGATVRATVLRMGTHGVLCGLGVLCADHKKIHRASALSGPRQSNRL